MPSFRSNARAELRALTFPLGRKTKYRLHALANDALATVSKPERFNENLTEQWRRILGRSQGVLDGMPAATGPRVLFGAMFGQVWITRPFEAAVAMALRLRGAQSFILACDSSLGACEWNPYGNGVPDPGKFGEQQWPNATRHFCTVCQVKLEESYDLPGLERVAISRYARPGDAERAQRLADPVTLADLRDAMHNGVNVGEHAYAALLRATMRGIPLDDERTRWMAKRYLASCIMLAELGERAFDDVQPDHFVAADGVYVLAGTLCEVARNRGIHVVVHGPPYRKGTVWLSHKDCYHRRLVTEKNDDWHGLEMNEQRTRVAEDYLASKHMVARDYLSYHVDSIQDDAGIRKEVGLDERPIVSLYTNILWDSQLYYRFKVFPNLLEWLYRTIRYYEKRQDLQLAIRLHPGEARGAWPTQQPILPELQREFPTLPSNVKVIVPESKVSSYVLGTMSALSLIYGARVGVELVMLGTPVIVAGEAFLRGKGFSYDPTSEDEYFALLDQGAALPRPTPEQRALATKWYYQYFFRMMMPFPYCEDKGNGLGTRLTFRSLAELLPGRSPVLDRICQGILDGKTPFEWDEFENAPA